MPAAWGNAPKDPDAIRDYGMDWEADIGSETITGSTWEVVAGTVTILQDSHDETKTVARVTGGVDGETAKLKNHIVLSNGEEDEFTGELSIEER